MSKKTNGNANETNTHNATIHEVQIRKLLLDFYSSQLTTHSRLIIGFAALLFTVLTLFVDLKEPQLVQEIVTIVGIFTVSTGFWFLIMRHLTYGHLSSTALHAPLAPLTSLHDASIATRDHVLEKRILSVIPTALFCTVGREVKLIKWNVTSRKARLVGIILCLVLGIATTLMLAILVGIAVLAW